MFVLLTCSVSELCGDHDSSSEQRRGLYTAVCLRHFQTISEVRHLAICLALAVYIWLDSSDGRRPRLLEMDMQLTRT